MYQSVEITADPPLRLQRSRGEASVALAAAPSGFRLTGLRQQGSAKVILPNIGGAAEAVFLNTSGGLTGGDHLSYAVSVGAGLSVTATTQTAERAYKSTQGPAQVRVDLTVGRGGWLDWLPQETILFDRSAMNRKTRLALQGDAGGLILETVVLGRAAMGEVVQEIFLRDWREVTRDGAPLWVEPVLLTDRALTTGPAGLNGVRAFSTLALICDDAPDLLTPLRRVLDEPGVTAAASALPGRLILRAHAADSWPLRRQIVKALAVVRRGRPLPRVWQM